MCENDFNTKAVVLIENGADDYLDDNESKERFFAEMIQAGVEWNFHDRPGTPHGFVQPTTLVHPGHLHERSGYRSTVKMLALFKDIFLEPNKITLLETQSVP
ncbi:MAG: hypothetical protein VW729_16220 [Deltaproteobacteria bacterium]